MINWRNIAENLMLTLVSVAFGILIGWQLTIKTVDTTLNQQKSIIEEAIRKETTSITNEVKTEIRKIKGKKSAPISIKIDPNINSSIAKQDTSVIKPREPREKGGFFKGLFSKEERLKRKSKRIEKRNQKN